jgi:hypothetical protein
MWCSIITLYIKLDFHAFTHALTYLINLNLWQKKISPSALYKRSTPFTQGPLILRQQRAIIQRERERYIEIRGYINLYGYHLYSDIRDSLSHHSFLISIHEETEEKT